MKLKKIKQWLQNRGLDPTGDRETCAKRLQEAMKQQNGPKMMMGKAVTKDDLKLRLPTVKENEIKTDFLTPPEMKKMSSVTSIKLMGVPVTEDDLKLPLPKIKENEIKTDFLTPPEMKKMSSATSINLMGVPVTEADPLGALSKNTSPMMQKSATASELLVKPVKAPKRYTDTRGRFSNLLGGSSGSTTGTPNKNVNRVLFQKENSDTNSENDNNEGIGPIKSRLTSIESSETNMGMMMGEAVTKDDMKLPLPTVKENEIKPDFLPPPKMKKMSATSIKLMGVPVTEKKVAKSELKMKWTLLENENMRVRCDSCKDLKTFSEFKNFKQHHESVHIFKNIHCQVLGCEKKFSCKRYLRDHMRRSHGISAKMIASTSKPKATKQSAKKQKEPSKKFIAEEPQNMDVKEESINVKEEPIED